MKKFLLVLLIVVVGGHYIAWNYVATQAEKNFHHMIAGKMQYSMGEFDYTLKKSGYPSHIALEMTDMTFTSPDIEVSLDAEASNGVRVAVPFSFNPHTFVIAVNDINYTAHVSAPEGEVDMTFAIGESESTVINVGDDYTVSGFVDDLALEMNLPEEGSVRVHIGSVDLNEQTKTVGNKINSHIAMKMADAVVTVNDGEKDISFNIDSCIVQGGVKNFPNTVEAFMDKVMPLVEEVKSGTESFDTTEVKTYLKNLLHQMAKNNSIIYFDELSYKLSGLPEIDTFGFALNTELSVVDDYTLRGTVGLKLNGLSKVAEMLMKQRQSSGGMMHLPPMALAFMQAGSLEVSLKTDQNGMLIFNGMPVFQLPPLDGLIDSIPDTISKNGM